MKGDGGSMKTALNNGFWDLPAEERNAIMKAACERAGAENFFDLDPEDRRRAYENACAGPDLSRQHG